MKRIYRSIIHELYPGEYEWRHLSPEQEERQRQRGRDLAKLRPWERGRIGKIEKQISWKMTVGRFGAWGGKLEYTTGALARLIYCAPLLHKVFGECGPPPEVKHWQYERVRKAASTFADRVGRSTGRGRPVRPIRPQNRVF